MSVELAYSQWAPSYDSDRNLTRDLDHDITRRLLAVVEAGTLIEAGCGTGKNSPFYASIATDVLALDLCDDMLALARSRPDCGNVRFLRHDISSSWPVADRCADLVAFNLVLEHLPSLEQLFSHAASACRTGASVYVSELHPYRQYRGGQARFRAEDGSEIRVPAFTHHISDFVHAAERCGLTLRHLGEWWHDEDARADPPRLLTLRFESH